MKEKQRETVVAGEEPTKYPHGSTQHWPKPTAKQEGGRGEQKGNQNTTKKRNRSDTITEQNSSSDWADPTKWIKCFRRKQRKNKNVKLISSC